MKNVSSVSHARVTRVKGFWCQEGLEGFQIHVAVMSNFTEKSVKEEGCDPLENESHSIPRGYMLRPVIRPEDSTSDSSARIAAVLKEEESLRLLLVSDPTIKSVTDLNEFLIPHAPQYDLCIACGPFSPEPGPDGRSSEEEAIAMADMSTIIAQLENIVCRVGYLPCEWDIQDTLKWEMHLTPNSVALQTKVLPLMPGLNVTGFTEMQKQVTDHGTPHMESAPDEYPEDGLEGNINLEQSGAAALLTTMLSQPELTTPDSTIFVLNYKFSHTLNNFLFHCDSELDNAHVNLCIIPTYNELTRRLPEKLGNVWIVVPRPLSEGFYTTIDLQKVAGSGRWSFIGAVTQKIRPETFVKGMR